MYSFVAKEIDYANYFQTVRVQKDETPCSLFARVTVWTGRNVDLEVRAPWLSMSQDTVGLTVLPVGKSRLLFLLVWTSPKT